MRRCIFTRGATSLVIKATDIVDDLPVEIPSKQFRRVKQHARPDLLGTIPSFQYAPSSS